MKKLLFSTVALSLVSAGFAQTFSTGFERNENAGWDPAGLSNSWAANSFSGNVNVVPGTGFVKNTGYIIAGAQSAEITSTTNNVTDYTAVRTVNTKKLFISTLMAPIAYNGTGVRGFGLFAGSGYRWVLAKTGVNNYVLKFSNGATFVTTDIATLTGANLENQTHYMSMDINISAIGANAGVAKLRFNNNLYTQNFNTTSGTSSMVSAGFMSRGVSGNSSGTARFDRFGYSAVPEPASMLAIGLGVVGLVARKRRK